MPLPLLLSAGASGGSAVDVDINPGLVALQLVLLALTWLVLKPLLFEPLLSLYEEREKRVDGARAEARRMDDQAAEMLRKYEKEIEQVHRVAAEERDRLRAEAQSLEAHSLDEARAEVGAVLEQGRRAIADELGSVEAALAKDVDPLARSVAAQVLGREVHG
jgi:F-type H+-transporting ATPase subunit b